ncbi:hypothetical protein [Cellulomonas hominis]|uniref:hypothetical protein n=1 Tax=Cellulomonas hominis TaxID=156981 RepID=UPI001B8DF82C|nr:hypothetical protein [Cellulomonas hominis]VTR76860.1 hypothetical protein CHMI_01627 [Cellulomonas hominis]
MIALGVTGLVLSAVTGEPGWALVCATASGVALASLGMDRLTERGRRVLDVVAVSLAAVLLVGVVVLLAVTDGFADSWYLVVLAAVLLAGFLVGVRVRRRREADAPPRAEVARRARAGQDGPHD